MPSSDFHFMNSFKKEEKKKKATKKKKKGKEDNKDKSVY